MIRKVVIVHTDFRLYWPSRLRHLNRCFVRRGVDLFVIEIAGKGSPYSFSEGRTPEKELCWIQLFSNCDMEDIAAGQAVDAVIGKLNELDPDAVIAGAIAFPAGAAATRWCLQKKKPIILFDDVRLADVPRPIYINWVKKQVYSLIDAMVIPASSHDPTYRYFGFSKEMLFYGVNAVDNSFFSCDSTSPSRSLPQGFPESPFLLGVGRQIPKKNWKTLIAAFRNIADNSHAASWSLVLIGDGPEHAELTALAGDPLESRVFFVSFIQQKELVHYYHQAAALVLPSFFGETWGLVVNEAMAAGLPVLVSAKCGCSETLVQDGLNGYVFDPDSQEAIEEALLKFFSLDKARRDAMGAASLGIVADWGLERFSHGMCEALDFVQAKSKRRGTLAGRFIIRFWNGRYCPT